jgi:hypothetical protein
LEDDTIRLIQSYTERDTQRLRERVGVPANAPALMFPHFDREGHRIDYEVARLIPPYVFPGGKEAKYLCPRGRGHQPYFPPFECVWEALASCGGLLAIVEGILKAVALAQAGIPCIGLMGMEGWSDKDAAGERRLLAELNLLPWRGKTVLLLYDHDPVRKPIVHHGTVELARRLAGRGANPYLLCPPAGILGPDGRPLKQAMDDLYVGMRRIGPGLAADARLRAFLEARLAAPAGQSLDAWREEIVRARVRTLYSPGVYYDKSPTGAGKSHADIEALRRNEEAMKAQHYPTPEAREDAMKKLPRSLTLVPTHDNCAEVVAAQRAAGLESAAYPRLDSSSCVRFDEATATTGRGLSFMKALCPECEFRDGCPYHNQFEEARNARHAVATHSRARVSLPDLVRKRAVLSLHETPLDVLRPSFISDCGLQYVEMVARNAGYAAPKEDRPFYDHLRKVALDLEEALKGEPTRTFEVEPPPAMREPKGLHKYLNEACIQLSVDPPQEAEKRPLGEAMRLALAAALGDLSLLSVAVDELPAAKAEADAAAGDKPVAAADAAAGPSPAPGGTTSRGEVVYKYVRRLVGVSRLGLPEECVVWLGDATGSPGELSRLLGRPVQDITPGGWLPNAKDVLQVVPKADVTKSRTPAAVLPQLRGLLQDLPYRRVGLLTHQQLAKELPGLLEERYRGKLSRVSYFGSGYSRGSNVWTGECECLIVLGTPRVPPYAIRRHLLRLGKLRAAARNKEETAWGWDWWSALTVSGRRLTVRTQHYCDHDWHAAYCALVRSELVQAVGRGRGLLPSGIPVIVVTTENLAPDSDTGDIDGRGGPRVADRPLAPLTDAQARVLAALYRDGRVRVLRGLSVIARAAGVSAGVARDHLKDLEAAGRVRLRGHSWAAVGRPLPGGRPSGRS